MSLGKEYQNEEVSHQRIQSGMVAGADTGNGSIHHIDESAQHDRVFIGGNYDKRKIQQKKIHADGRSKEVCSTAETCGVHVSMLRRNGVSSHRKRSDKGRMSRHRNESV